MNTLNKLEKQFRKIHEIKYENQNGGAYAYLQFMAMNRELMGLIKKAPEAKRELSALEGISWLLNEYLASRFTPRHKAIFETKMLELNEIMASLRHTYRRGRMNGRRRRIYASAA